MEGGYLANVDVIEEKRWEGTRTPVTGRVDVFRQRWKTERREYFPKEELITHQPHHHSLVVGYKQMIASSNMKTRIEDWWEM